MAQHAPQVTPWRSKHSSSGSFKSLPGPPITDVSSLRANEQAGNPSRFFSGQAVPPDEIENKSRVANDGVQQQSPCQQGANGEQHTRPSGQAAAANSAWHRRPIEAHHSAWEGSQASRLSTDLPQPAETLEPTPAAHKSMPSADGFGLLEDILDLPPDEFALRTQYPPTAMAAPVQTSQPSRGGGFANATVPRAVVHPPAKKGFASAQKRGGLTQNLLRHALQNTAAKVSATWLLLHTCEPKVLLVPARHLPHI